MISVSEAVWWRHFRYVNVLYFLTGASKRIRCITTTYFVFFFPPPNWLIYSQHNLAYIYRAVVEYLGKRMNVWILCVKWVQYLLLSLWTNRTWANSLTKTSSHLRVFEEVPVSGTVLSWRKGVLHFDHPSFLARTKAHCQKMTFWLSFNNINTTKLKDLFKNNKI